MNNHIIYISYHRILKEHYTIYTAHETAKNSIVDPAPSPASAQRRVGQISSLQSPTRQSWALFRFGLAPRVGSWSFRVRLVALIQHVLEFQVWQRMIKTFTKSRIYHGFTQWMLDSRHWFIKTHFNHDQFLVTLPWIWMAKLSGLCSFRAEKRSVSVYPAGINRKFPKWGGFNRKIICK